MHFAGLIPSPGLFRHPLLWFPLICGFTTAQETRRVELNLLGKEDATAGESRRNENIQFNLVDNNALKELNIRLGATATILSEFRADRGYFGSEFGNAPSSPISITPASRPGWHGELFLNHLNSVFSARSFFQVGDVKPAHENRYGVRSGWKPWRGGYVYLTAAQDKLRGNVNGNVLVPLPSERTPTVTDPERRALIERYLAAYPSELPNRPDINIRSLNTNAVQAINNSDLSARLDQSLGVKDRIYSQYQNITQYVDAFQLVAGQNPNTATRSHRARLTWARTWTPTLVTMVSGGFDRVGSLLTPDASAVGPMVSTAGLTTLGPLATIPINRAQNLFRYEGSVARTSDRHRFYAGGLMTRRQQNGSETDAHRGVVTFANDFGRSGIANLLYGTPSQGIISIGDVHRGYRQTLGAFYAGDAWRITQNFTLSYGLRYEIATSPYEVNGLNEIPYNCDCNNVAPRLGFSWRLPKRGGILRAAYGVHYGDIFPVTYSQVRFSPPGSVKLAIPAPDLLNPLQGGDPKGNRYLLDSELASPYSYQYNFSWEPDFSSKWRLQLGYTGSRSHKLLVMWYLNRAHAVAGIPQITATINQRRADPDLAEIRWVLNGSQGYFDAGRVTLIAPRVAGFTVDTSYWFSKAMDLGADYTNTAYDADSRLSRSQSEFETHKDRKALSNFDQPHAFLARVSYALAEKRWKGLAGRVGNGWNASAVVLLKKGTPFSVTTSDSPGYGNVDGSGNDRPILLDPSVLGRTVGNPDTSVASLPISAFGFISPTSEAGTLGANVFRRGGIHNVNAALSRTFALTTAMRLMFRAESINLFNSPQFAEPGSVLGTPEFGFITNTLNDGRTMRFGLQLGW